MVNPEGKGKVVYKDGNGVNVVRGDIRREEGFLIVETDRGDVWVALSQVHAIKFLDNGDTDVQA